MVMSAVLTLLALLIEDAFGYPDWLAQRIGHPVTWIGRLIDVEMAEPFRMAQYGDVCVVHDIPDKLTGPGMIEVHSS